MSKGHAGKIIIIKIALPIPVRLAEEGTDEGESLDLLI